MRVGGKEGNGLGPGVGMLVGGGESIQSILTNIVLFLLCKL